MHGNEAKNHYKTITDFEPQRECRAAIMAAKRQEMADAMGIEEIEQLLSCNGL